MGFEWKTSTVYTCILGLPALGFIFSNETIQSQANFILVIGLIFSAYFCHTYQWKTINYVRKCVACLSTALLILFLSAEVSHVLLSVYKVSFGEEVTFMIKMVLMISNMEGNLDLCLDKEEKLKAEGDSVI